MRINNSFGLLLGSGLTASTNPNPNSLSTPSPYSSEPETFEDVSAAWVAQGAKAIFPNYTQAHLKKDRKLWFAAIPSAAGATFDLTVWFYHKESGTWISPVIGATERYGPEEYADYIDEFPQAPIFLEISNLSAGTVSIYVDERSAGCR